MRTEMFYKSLGELTTDSILSILGLGASPVEVEWLRTQAPLFNVTLEFEISILDETEIPHFVGGKLPKPPGKKLVRLVLEPQKSF